MNQQLVVDIPYSPDAKISSRSKKFVICLQMVHFIFRREISQPISIDLFNRLAIVAGFIDHHLDELSLDQQRSLLRLYTALFDKIWDADHYLIFRNEICKFVEEQSFVFQSEAIHLKDLFLFIQHCKTNNKREEIKTFGHTIISLAINKQEATKSDALIYILSLEGEAVVGLLKTLLHKEFSNKKALDKTLDLLKRLEHILNVADDALDVSADRQAKLISAALGPFHRLKMLIHLAVHTLKTIAYYPIKIAYYLPRLTWFYLGKILK
jgi:hypothetical protein